MDPDRRLDTWKTESLLEVKESEDKEDSLKIEKIGETIKTVEQAESQEEKEKENINLTKEECTEKIDLLRETRAVRPKEAALRRQIIDAVMWGESELYGAIPVESSEERYNADKIIPVEDAKELPSTKTTAEVRRFWDMLIFYLKRILTADTV